MNQIIRFLLAASLVFAAVPAFAGIDEIYSPVITPHEAEIEYEGVRLSDGSSAQNNAQSHEVEMKYGLNEDWLVGLVGEASRTSAQSFRTNDAGALVIYSMTRQSDWWLNSALFGEFDQATHKGAADNGEGRLLLSRAEGPLDVTANLIFGHEIGSNRDAGVGVGSSLQGIYTLNEHFSPGVEWFADYGKLNRFSGTGQQQHYVGPVISGELFDLESSEVEYTAGYYWGLTRSSANQAARIELEYELKF